MGTTRCGLDSVGYLVSFLALLLSLGTADPIRADEENPRGTIATTLPADVANERAQALLTELHSALQRIDRYKTDLESTSSEDSLVVQLQLSTLQIRALEDLHELADVATGLGEEDRPPDLLARVESTFVQVTPAIWLHVDRLRRDIDKSRAKRPSVSPSEGAVLEDRIARETARLDEVYELAYVHLQKIEMLGSDPSEDEATLSASLTSRADELSGRIDLAVQRTEDLRGRLRVSPDDADLTRLLTNAEQSLRTNTSSMETVIGLMESLELPTDFYAEQLVTATRDLSSGITDRRVAGRLLSRWMEQTTAWIVENGPRFLIKTFLLLSILLVFFLLSRLVRKGLERSISASKLNISTLLRRTLVTTASNLFMVLGFLIALSQIGISLGPLMAGLGVIGFILGFALQDTLSNFAAGLMILIYRPYDVGDMVDVSGSFGEVNKMSLVSTTILTIDNQTLVIPNSKIWGDVIKNVTAQRLRRVDMIFGISYTDDIPKTETVLMDLLESHEKVLSHPKPMVRLHELGDSSVNFVVRPWVEVDDYWDVFWDVTRAVKLRFDEEGISIPFPQRDVHVFQETDAPEEESE